MSVPYLFCEIEENKDITIMKVNGEVDINNGLV